MAKLNQKPPPTKRSLLQQLLSRPEGACLSDITTTTGWQPHTARAALTGLRKRGLNIDRQKVDGVSRYRTVQGS